MSPSASLSLSVTYRGSAGDRRQMSPLRISGREEAAVERARAALHNANTGIGATPLNAG
jgi:hypothetical protein